LLISDPESRGKTHLLSALAIGWYGPGDRYIVNGLLGMNIELECSTPKNISVVVDSGGGKLGHGHWCERNQQFFPLHHRQSPSNELDTARDAHGGFNPRATQQSP
jgi:hypothetical protein